MFTGVTLSQSNYEATLNGWANQQIQQGVIFDGGDSQFCDFTGRNNLINDHNWVITDGGQAEECPISFDVSYTLTENDITVSFDIVNFVVESQGPPGTPGFGTPQNVGHIHYSINDDTPVMIYSSNDLTISDLPYGGDINIVFSFPAK
jgi:hypothetical protein